MALYAPFVGGQPTSFRALRMMLRQFGEVEGTNDGFVVSERAGSPNMSVDVSVGTAAVEIDTGALSGIAQVINDAVANVSIPTADATLPRIDQVLIQYNDTSIPAGVGGNTPTLRLLQGTPTAGATLDNRLGAAALPNDALRLADVLVPALARSIPNANVRDRRVMMHGYRRVFDYADGGTWTLSGGTLTELIPGPTFEAAGRQVDVNFTANIGSPLPELVSGAFFLYVNGTELPGSARRFSRPGGYTSGELMSASWRFSPVGRTTLSLRAQAIGGSGIYIYRQANSNGAAQYSVTEHAN